ncbi:MAG: hypothetical protein ACO1SV_11745 [Fimbriimonas sp.]
MRFQRDVVHPSIFAASDRITERMWMTGGFSGTPEEMKAYAEHSALWWKEYGRSLILGFIACVASFAGVAVVEDFLPKAATVVLAVSLIAFWIGVSVVGYKRNKRSLTPQELRALAPAMDLTAIQRVYADALVAVAELGLPDPQYREVVGELNRLLDEEARLLALRERGGSPASHEEIQKERTRLAERLATMQDPIAAEAIRRSLEICEARLHAATELSLVEQRVEAQIEMIDQAIRGIRDSLLRLRTAPTSMAAGLDIDAVRHTVDAAHHHTVALEKAVDEVRTLA